MNVQLDEALILQAKRAPPLHGLSLNERIALNLLWRKDVRVPVLAKVFVCSKNSIYANCLAHRGCGVVCFRPQRSVKPTRSSTAWVKKRHGAKTSRRP